MSCIDWPRTLSGLCSPSAQSTASVTFDLPQPFGPTITLTPGENTSLVRSGKDLKPLIVIELRCMRRMRAPGSLAGGPDATSGLRSAIPTRRPLERLLRRRLLGGLLRAPGALADDLAVDAGGDLEQAVVRGSGLAGDLVLYARALAGQLLLERRLEVEQALGGELDLARERGDRRLAR